jgi:hypothetical protein
MSHRHAASLVALLLAACSSAAGPDARDEPALIRFGGQTARVTAPAVAAAGSNVALTVETFGGGCTRETARAEVVPASTAAGGSDFALARLFNRTTGARACTDDLAFLEHRVVVPAGGPGALVIRISGANRGAETDWNTVPWVLTHTVTVR